MKIEQIYTGCLAQGAYYIESNGEAAIIDPLRETKPYIDKAANDNAKIKYILETHFHADFVSGHIDLAKKTGGTIVYGPKAKAEFDFHEARDGEVLKLGDIQIKVVHTPGHTQESTTYLLIDENGKDVAIFSGDTLFIGDVGRPDLAVKTELSREDLAGMLFDSLREKIMVLNDDVLVYPGHGAGSACGKNMSKETVDKLGNQKLYNYALRADMTKDEFIKEVTEGLSDPPQYFPKNVLLNQQGYESFDEIMEKGNTGWTVDEFEGIVNNEEDVLILDARAAQVFNKGYIPNSIFIGIDGNFAPWVGELISNLEQPILFLAEEGREEEVVTRLARVGYNNTIGYLKGGIEAWKEAGKAVDTIISISADDLKEKLKGDIHVLDVRKDGEFSAEHIDVDGNKLKSFPLSKINDNMGQLDPNVEYHVHCAGGYRSMIASSILKARGFDKLIEIKGGFKAIREAGIDTTDYVCPSMLRK